MTLFPEELNTIGSAIAELEVVGTRYPDAVEKMTGL